MRIKPKKGEILLTIALSMFAIFAYLSILSGSWCSENPTNDIYIPSENAVESEEWNLFGFGIFDLIWISIVIALGFVTFGILVATVLS